MTDVAGTATDACAHAVFEASVLGLVVLDQNGRVSALNPTAARLLGADEAMLRRRSWHQVVDSAYAEQVADGYEELLSGRLDRIHGVMRVGTGGKQRRTVIVDTSLLRAPDGSGAGLLLQLRDVTWERDSDRWAVALEDSWQQLADNVDALVSRHSPDGRCLAASTAGLPGVPPDLLLAHRLEEWADETTGERVAAAFAQTVGASKRAEVDWQMDRPDGRGDRLHSVFWPYAAQVGSTPPEVHAVTRVSREVGPGADAVIEAIPVAAALLRDGQVGRANTRYHALLRLARHQPRTMSGEIHVGLSADDLNRAEEGARRLDAGEVDVVRFEARLARGDGTVIWVQVRLTRIEGENSAHLLCLLDPSTEREQSATLGDPAHRDPLTGLGNRRYVVAALRAALRQASQTGGGVGVLFCDLNGFKQINDRWGHQAGDEALIEVARRIEHLLRAGDVAGRLGGDEFLVVCSSIGHRSDLDQISRRIRTTIGLPFWLGSRKVRLDVSVGIHLARANEEAEVVLQRADRAMYRIKRAERAAD